MSRQVVFLVHGIGDHKIGWSKSAVQSLDALGQRYSTVGAPISEQVVFAEVAYGEVFDKQLARWDTDVDAFAANGVVPQAKDAVAWLDGVTEGGFVWTHLGDVVLFLSRFTRAAAVAEVVAQMAKVIADDPDPETEFSIIAHSMGTAVTMEAVNALVTPIPKIGWTGLPPDFRFREVMMLANTSRFFQRPELHAYTESRLLPKKYKTTGLCSTYRNVYHRRDPVALFRRFAPNASDDMGYVAVPVEHYHARNIHGLTHYFEHPAVHGAVLRLPKAGNLPLAAWNKAREQYSDSGARRFGGEFAKLAEVDAFVEDLDQAVKPDPESEVDLVGQLKYVADLLRKML
jgi:hypothetical protein